jgi:arginase family enzyme
MSADHPLQRYFELPDEMADEATAKAAILPVPYDRTATWKKGAAGAPEAILEASQHIELYDVVTGVEACTWGIATLDPIISEGPPEELADLVDEAVGDLIEGDKLPVILGGNHSISIGAIRAAARLVPDMTVLQLDALLEQVAQRRKVIAFDVVELLPTPDQRARDFLAAKLVYRFLGRIFSSYQPST